MNTVVYVLLLIGGVIAPAVFAVCGLFFLACAFAQCSEVWERRQDKRSHVEALAYEISRQALQLDEVRLGMFLRWLHNHSLMLQLQSSPHSQPASPSSMRRNLETNMKHWLESFPISGQLWEYHLVLTEIAWWRDLDCARLKKFMHDCLGNEL